MISAWQFCDVFREQWKREDAGSIRSIYRDEGPWTEFMLGNGVTYQNSFLYRVSERLSLQRKLPKLLEMRQQADGYWPEADQTEYLFLVGNRVKEGELPRWRYSIVNGGRFSYVDTPPPLVSLC